MSPLTQGLNYRSACDIMRTVLTSEQYILMDTCYCNEHEQYLASIIYDVCDLTVLNLHYESAYCKQLSTDMAALYIDDPLINTMSLSCVYLDLSAFLDTIVHHVLLTYQTLIWCCHPQFCCRVVSVLCVTVEDATSSEMADLIKEMEIMKTIGHHTNLRGLLGCCTQSGKCFLVESITETETFEN